MKHRRKPAPPFSVHRTAGHSLGGLNVKRVSEALAIGTVVIGVGLLLWTVLVVVYVAFFFRMGP